VGTAASRTTSRVLILLAFAVFGLGVVEMLVVEAGRKQPFYAKVSLHDRGSATVRVDPMTHPERSQGVREIVARLAQDLLARTPGARVGATNLELPERPR